MRAYQLPFGTRFTYKKDPNNIFVKLEPNECFRIIHTQSNTDFSQYVYVMNETYFTFGLVPLHKKVTIVKD